MEIDHQKYGLVFSVYGQYLVTVFVSVFLSGLLRQNCVCECHFKSHFLFIWGIVLSYFPHYFTRKCGGKICILVKLKTT